MEISLEKYEAMQDRIAHLEVAMEIKSKQFNYALDLVVERDDEIFRLRAKQPHWISAKDKLPEEDSRVLAFVENGIMIANYLEGWFYYIENEDGDMCPSDDIEVSYWMPLPEPPEVEDNAAD